MANSDIYAEIAEQQNQTLLDTKLTSLFGVNSNQVGKLANDANRVIMNNALQYKQRDSNDKIANAFEDTSERDNLVKKGKVLIEETRRGIKNYAATEIYLNKMKVLRKKYATEKHALEDSVDGIVATVHTNNRRVEYQTPEMERISNVRSLITISFYIILLVYLVRSKFVQRGLYRNPRMMIVILICALLPFLVDPLVNYLFRTMQHISVLWNTTTPRNVYVNI